MQLTPQFVVLTEQLGVFLFELADAQGRWWQRCDLFWRESKGGLELGHGLLKLRRDNRCREMEAKLWGLVPSLLTCSM